MTDYMSAVAVLGTTEPINMPLTINQTPINQTPAGAAVLAAWCCNAAAADANALVLP
jgi:hypothetical protein